MMLSRAKCPPPRERGSYQHLQLCVLHQGQSDQRCKRHAACRPRMAWSRCLLTCSCCTPASPKAAQSGGMHHKCDVLRCVPRFSGCDGRFGSNVTMLAVVPSVPDGRYAHTSTSTTRTPRHLATLERVQQCQNRVCCLARTLNRQSLQSSYILATRCSFSAGQNMTACLASSAGMCRILPYHCSDRRLLLASLGSHATRTPDCPGCVWQGACAITQVTCTRISPSLPSSFTMPVH